MKKYTAILLIVTIMLCGCGSTNNEKGDVMNHNAYRSGSWKQQADKLMTTISQALDEEDAVRLKSVFSEETQASCPELDQEIRELFDYYNGPSVSFNGKVTYATGHTSLGRDDNGKLVDGQGYWDIQGEYEVQTESEKYWVTFAFYSDYESAPEKNGIYCFEIITDALMEAEGIYRHSVETNRGIFIDR